MITGINLFISAKASLQLRRYAEVVCLAYSKEFNLEVKKHVQKPATTSEQVMKDLPEDWKAFFEQGSQNAQL